MEIKQVGGKSTWPPCSVIKFSCQEISSPANVFLCYVSYAWFHSCLSHFTTFVINFVHEIDPFSLPSFFVNDLKKKKKKDFLVFPLPLFTFVLASEGTRCKGNIINSMLIFKPPNRVYATTQHN